LFSPPSDYKLDKDKARDIMDSTGLDAESEVWQAPGYGVRIEYSRALMEELRLAALDGFNRMGHGGVEIGGVLFGVRDPDAVKILAHRAVACEYAFGPSFTLWDNDKRALEKLLAAPDTDNNLAGMQPVGWYHSHTRSDILLSEKDLQLFQDYFPEVWQIALVLRPYRFDPLRAGFFFREPDGSVQAASSRHEFTVKPLGGEPVMLLPGDRPMADTVPAPARPLPELAPREPARLQPVLLESALRELAQLPHWAKEIAPSPQPPAIAHNPRRAAGGGYPRPGWARNLAKPTAKSVAASVATLAVVLAVVVFWIGNSRASAGLSLRALDVGGQLRIDWNRDSRVIQQSQSGTLEIEDGPVKVHHELSQEHLRAGSITYLRTTGNVLVRLLVHRADRSTLTEMSRFLGPPVSTGSAGTPIAAPAERAPAQEARRPEPSDLADPSDLPEPSEPRPEPSNLAEPALRPAPDRARQTTVASAPARRRLVLPPTSVPRLAEPLLPSLPVIATDPAAAMGLLLPRLPAPLNPADRVPAAGKIIWTGKLTRGGTIQILGDRASQGHITGSLPGAPIRVRVFPSELTPEGLRIFIADPRSASAPEAPGTQNGWNRTIYVLNPRKAGEIGIVEGPGQQNAWNRLTLRAERGDHSIIVLRWERVPPEAR
jgi:proteasome lid subunit RPN8/RPN11